MSSEQSGRAIPSIKDFVLALLEKNTYNPFRNIYTVFGFFWGLPIPFSSVGIELVTRNIPITLNNAVNVISNNPIHIFFLLHPILFSIVFGAMGTVRHKKDNQIESLLKQLESKVEELAKANEKLKELDKLKSDFMANVSHELKTPLVSIYGYTDMITTGRLGSINEKQRNGLEIVTRNINRLLELIEELLAFAHLEAKPTLLHLETFDITGATRSAISLLKLTAEKRLLTVVESYPSYPIYVKADKEKISHVITNLFSNAIKFTPAGMKTGIEVANKGNSVTVTVWDKGEGIPEEAIPYIFDRFYQVDGSSKRRHGGVGLGLAIVKNILDAHKCPISVKSKVNVGTAFTFELEVVSKPEFEKEIAYGKENFSSR